MTEQRMQAVTPAAIPAATAHRRVGFQLSAVLQCGNDHLTYVVNGV